MLRREGRQKWKGAYGLNVTFANGNNVMKTHQTYCWFHQFHTKPNGLLFVVKMNKFSLLVFVL